MSNLGAQRQQFGHSLLRQNESTKGYEQRGSVTERFERWIGLVFRIPLGFVYGSTELKSSAMLVK